MTTIPRRDEFIRIFIILSLGFCLFQSACTKAGFQTKEIYAKDQDRIDLIRRTDKEGITVPQGYSHPAAVEPEKMAAILGSLRYSEKILVKWHAKEEGVFDESEVKKLAAPISKALAAATADEWVSFEVTSYKRALFFKTRQLTTGWVWVENGKLNIVLGNFQFEVDHERHQGQDPYTGDPREHYSLDSYRIDAGPFNAPPPIDAAKAFMKKEHQNWTVVDLAAFQAPKVEAVAPPHPSAEERLEQLKALFDKGLITQEEYEAKRKEILDNL